MPIPKRTLSVYPNPYVGVDHLGRPASAVQVEPDLIHGDTNLHYVGATRVVTELTKARHNVEATHDRSFDFSPLPVEVMNTQYYHHHIKSRDLIAADVESWMACGLPRASFVDPKVALGHAKAGALHSYAAHYDNEDGPAEIPAALTEHWGEFHGTTKADSAPVADPPKSKKWSASAADATNPNKSTPENL